MRGYCASGNDSRATPPASVMTIDSTDAKIGRSMKKRENKGHPPYFDLQRAMGTSLGCTEEPGWTRCKPLTTTNSPAETV